MYGQDNNICCGMATTTHSVGDQVRSGAALSEQNSLATADYARAEQFMPYCADELVLHSVEALQWLSDGTFCYRTRTSNGFVSFIVDPVRNKKELAFDEEKVRSALQRARGMRSSQLVPLNTLEFKHDDENVSFRIGTQRWSCDRAGNECMLLHTMDASGVLSHDKQREAFIRDHNIWVRELADGRETQLTTDGVQGFSYATNNSGRRHTSLPVLLWSPDSQRIATFQLDERDIGEMCLVRIQHGHPHVETWKYAMPIDDAIPAVHRVIVDVKARHVTRLQMPCDLVRSASWLGLTNGPNDELEAQWSADSNELAFISISRDHKCAHLRIADAASGEVRDVLLEESATFYDASASLWHALRRPCLANWRYLHASREIIWYSSRNNWRHLYLYDAETGRLKQQITCGNWNVVTTWNVDEVERVIYFSAIGRETGRNPYFEHLYRVGFDGGDLRLLTPEDATHVIWTAPSGRYFVDSYSRPDAPPTTVLRDCNGVLIRRLERADISRLKAKGWQPPVVLEIKARDGLTDLYGLMFMPSRMDERRKYPIVNAVHSGPLHGSVFPRGPRGQWGVFSASYGALGDAQSLAELGFIVVMIDGMGTPLRSAAFQQFSYGNYGDVTLPDQIAGMKQLADRYSWIDLDRAGVYGVSHGGYAAARAMLTYPDFFKVGVSMCGCHDFASYQDEYTEKFFGRLVRNNDGTSNYDAQTNLGLAHNLRGRLLLAHGTLDENVPFYQTLLLAQELIAANKDFDLLLLPNATHAISDGDPGRYLVRRHWNYFIRHLLGAVPVEEYRMRGVTECPET